eukprot:CAMPEP_0203682786 /NCGR_PEP_ID=MMETSP0090-20130426/47141_1 /ASSEMBLY_ACC=CAM_ASM_001088 /TAXON_ID=426623 /ORGANISM="Chaetoceros affinis, Strain CCMP159" /LENGTH=40 /DNA_ID= /DNA_START= /DNA_END= /DNA_ORIENTATION=
MTTFVDIKKDGVMGTGVIEMVIAVVVVIVVNIVVIDTHDI